MSDENTSLTRARSRREAMKLALAGVTMAMTAFNVTGAFADPIASTSVAQDQSFNDDWLFQRGDVAGAQAPVFDDEGWQVVHLPHDYMVDDVYSTAGDQATSDPAPWSTATGPAQIGPFTDDTTIANSSMAWIPGVVGWYRKYFICPTLAAGGRVVIRFDGIFQDADIYVNGTHVDFHAYGYTTFTIDLTKYVAADRPNVIALRVNPSGASARWYAGGGINRNTWLTFYGPVSIPYAGIIVRTHKVSNHSANVRVITHVDVSSVHPNASVVVSITDPTGKTVAQAYVRDDLSSGSTKVPVELTVEGPTLWSVENPYLYLVTVQVLNGAKRVLHSRTSTLGIRTVTIDVNNGFSLNGVSLKLEGGCVHSTYGVLGSAAIDAASYQHVKWLKAAGFNAVRTAHNPPAPEFLDACDQLGLLVYEEAFDVWEKPKTAQDYSQYFDEYGVSDIVSMVVRDRNHPSVVLWSIGNEINNGAATQDQINIERELHAAVRQEDPTRLITLGGAASGGAHPTALYPGEQVNYVDLVDLHYTVTLYPVAHADYPTKPVVTSESWPYQVYDSWLALQTYSYAIGDFVWTALDYLGESGVGRAFLGPIGTPSPSFPPGGGLGAPFPYYMNYPGDISLIGVRKPQSYYRDVVWGRSDLEVFVQRPVPAGDMQVLTLWGWYDELPSWTWPDSEGQDLTVDVYTSGDEVKLFVNGDLVASKSLTVTDAKAVSLSVAYAPGTLTTQAYKNGVVIATSTLTTVGAPAAIQLVTDTPNISSSRSDLAYVYAQVVDAKGRVVPDAVVNVHFTVDGQGTVAGVGNGNPRNMASFKELNHYTFHSSALIVVRPDGSSGQIRISASARGLRTANLKILTT